MTHANIPLIRKVWDWVQEQEELREQGHKSEWDQGTWYMKTGCGTTCCIAGKVALMEPTLIDIGMEKITYRDDDGSLISEEIPEYATDALGLDQDVADDLFEAHTGIEDVKRIFSNVLASEGERL